MASGKDGTQVLGECGLIDCQKKSIKNTDGRTDVRSFAVSDDKRSGFKVDWDNSGMAKFHKECWKLLHKTAKGASDSPIALTDQERDMIKEAAKTAEMHNSFAELQKEAEHISQLIKNSKHCIAFTGAGISTAAGIGDFRGINGKWTERDKVKQYGKDGASKVKSRNFAALRPTYTHEALVKLIEKGYLKYIISQNVDGLHCLSGVNESSLSELHGNTFVEKCETCGKRYERSYRCGGKATNVPENKCKNCRINHRTGRVCDDKKCKGYLMNTIINFGDYLEKGVLENAEEQAERADLVLALGSTLQVSPANTLVEAGQKPIRLVICNRQTTDYDNKCTEKDENGKAFGSRVFGDCDKLFKELMKLMLSEAELKEWEGSRDVRMVTYDAKRMTTEDTNSPRKQASESKSKADVSTTKTKGATGSSKPSRSVNAKQTKGGKRQPITSVVHELASDSFWKGVENGEGSGRLF